VNGVIAARRRSSATSQQVSENALYATEKLVLWGFPLKGL
jgi:hypothetical protein